MGKIRLVTLDVDDDLLAMAREYVGLMKTGMIVREALRALVAREAGRRSARLGESQPGFKAAPRRRE